MNLRTWPVFVLFAASAAFAAQRGPSAYLTPEEAGKDLQIQGEYECTVNGGKAAAQVLSLGGGKFHVVGFYGGLPGDGWDGSAKIELDGEMRDGKVVFTRDSESMTIADGKATLKLQDGSSVELKRIVRESPTMGAKPPQGAIVLFDGAGVDAFRPGAKMDDRKLLTAGATTKQNFENFTLHAEFLLPFMPTATGQARANSGIYIQNRYEMQILDSFGLKGDTGDCGAVYRQIAPKLNMCLPPLQWQTYDIDFTAPKWQDGKKTANAVITVRLNGATIHDKQEVKTKTGAGQAEGPTPGPIQFQNHTNPVFFRNIWIVEKK